MNSIDQLMQMPRNVGRADRYLRITLGGLMLAAGAARMAQGRDSGILLGLLGGMTLADGILGTCPYYSMTGISTNQQDLPEPGRYTNDVIQPYEGI